MNRKKWRTRNYHHAMPSGKLVRCGGPKKTVTGFEGKLGRPPKTRQASLCLQLEGMKT